jgi:hypothetical protein
VHPVHSHHRYEETIYGVRRTMMSTVDGVTPEVADGGAHMVRRGP